MIKVTYIGHSSVLVEWPIIITKGEDLSFKSKIREYPKVCVNLQTDVR